MLQTHSSLSSRKSPEPLRPLALSLPARLAAELQGLTLHLHHTAFKLHHLPPTPPSHDGELKSFSYFYFSLLSLKISIQIFHLLYNILSSSGNENNHREASKSQLSLACSGEASAARLRCLHLQIKSYQTFGAL